MIRRSSGRMSPVTMNLENIHSILVVKFKRIGDVLLTTPLFRNLRIHFPSARICATVLENTVPMLSDNPDIDTIFPIDRNTGIWRQLRYIFALRREKFDLVIDLSDGDRGAIVSFLTGSPRRLGYRMKTKKLIGRELLFTDLMDNRDKFEHAVTYHLEPLRRLGIPVKNDRMRLHWSHETDDTVSGVLRNSGIEPGDPFVVVHPTSYWFFKCWLPERNAAVIDFLWERFRIAVIVTGSIVPVEMEFVRKMLAEVHSPVIDLAGKLNLKQLAALIRRAVLFFGVDTAPMHMAAAVGTPVVALFGPSLDHVWKPWGDGHVVIRMGLPCQPCDRLVCEGSPRSRCMDMIEVDSVARTLEAKLLELGYEPR